MISPRGSEGKDPTCFRGHAASAVICRCRREGCGNWRIGPGRDSPTRCPAASNSGNGTADGRVAGDMTPGRVAEGRRGMLRGHAGLVVARDAHVGGIAGSRLVAIQMAGPFPWWTLWQNPHLPVSSTDLPRPFRAAGRFVKSWEPASVAVCSTWQSPHNRSGLSRKNRVSGGIVRIVAGRARQLGTFGIGPARRDSQPKPIGQFGPAHLVGMTEMRRALARREPAFAMTRQAGAGRITFGHIRRSGGLVRRVTGAARPGIFRRLTQRVPRRRRGFAKIVQSARDARPVGVATQAQFAAGQRIGQQLGLGRTVVQAMA